ncbi:hypothetical protein C8R43DRAFT_1119449 [Mycena crocata]|nr:hypothetical protein C8R43DRAFT_1119449 [Mycena crocata]
MGTDNEAARLGTEKNTLLDLMSWSWHNTPSWLPSFRALLLSPSALSSAVGSFAKAFLTSCRGIPFFCGFLFFLRDPLPPTALSTAIGSPATSPLRLGPLMLARIPRPLGTVYPPRNYAYKAAHAHHVPEAHKASDAHLALPPTSTPRPLGTRRPLGTHARKATPRPLGRNMRTPHRRQQGTDTHLAPHARKAPQRLIRNLNAHPAPTPTWHHTPARPHMPRFEIYTRIPHRRRQGTRCPHSNPRLPGIHAHMAPGQVHQ